jgi:hypothetical protein
VLTVASGTFKSNAPNQPSRSTPGSARRRRAARDHRHDRLVRRLAARLPGNIDVQGGFGGGKIAIKGSVGAKGTNLQLTARDRTSRCSVPTCGCRCRRAGPMPERQGLDPAQQPQGRGAEPQGRRSEIVGEATFRHDRSGTPVAACNIDAARSISPACAPHR